VCQAEGGIRDRNVTGVQTCALPILEGISSAEEITEVVAGHAETPPAGDLLEQRHWIDTCYGADTVEEIVSRLRSHGDPEAAKAAETILSKSPTSVKVTLEALRRARQLPNLPAVLEQEYRISCAALTSPDLVEGVRAQIVDKDRNPVWDPARLEEVTDVERFFAPAPGGPLGLVDGDAR